MGTRTVPEAGSAVRFARTVQLRSCECDEKPKHTEKNNCRNFVRPLGKWRQELKMCFLFGQLDFNLLKLCNIASTALHNSSPKSFQHGGSAMIVPTASPTRVDGHLSPFPGFFSALRQIGKSVRQPVFR